MISILADPNPEPGATGPVWLNHLISQTGMGLRIALGTEESQVYSPGDPRTQILSYQIAVLHDLLEGDQFIWRVWLEGEILPPGLVLIS